MTDNSLSTLPEALDVVVQEHLKTLHKKIADRAYELAGFAGGSTPGAGNQISAIQCLTAINEIAPGDLSNIAATEKPSFWNRFADSVSPVTLISAVLTVIFAAFGLWALLSGHGDGKDAKSVNGQAYLDIAKIFAGAIVGSASVAVASTRRLTQSDPVASPNGKIRR
jgi:hypothetical protein